MNTLSHYAKTGTWTERGGRALTGKHAAKVAANSWLEFRYGLMPLIYTAQDVIKLVNSAYERSDATRIRSARASIKHSAPIGFKRIRFLMHKLLIQKCFAILLVLMT